MFIVIIVTINETVMVVSWIYNYLCNQCYLSPLTLRVQTHSGEVYSIQYVIKLSVTC